MPNQQTVLKAPPRGKIDKPVAGRDLDILIAVAVLGEKVVEERWGKQLQYGRLSLGDPDYYDSAGEMILSNPLPAYSQDIASAWEVLQHNHTYLDVRAGAHLTESWSVYLKTPKYHDRNVTGTEAHGSTAPEAICRAALRAVGYYWED